MAGLDTRGLADGFLSGFQVMNQYQRGQRADERADQQMGMQQERMDMQREQFGAQQEDAQRTRDMEELQFTLGKIGSGMEVDESEVELLKKYPKYWPALDSGTDASIEQAQSVIDPQSPVDANDPESLAALNQMFGAEINRGDGGQKRVVGMVPGPDGQSVMLELEVVGENGETYEAPMTQGRSNSEDDDLVMAVPVERLVDQVQGMRMLRNTMQTPEAQQRANQVLSLLRGDSSESWELEEHPRLGAIQRNTKTGEIKPVRPGAGSPYDKSGSSSGGRPPSRIQEAEALVERGAYDSFESAYEAVRARAGQNNPVANAQDELEYESGQLESVMEILNDRAARKRVGADEVARLEAKAKDIRARIPELEQRAFNREPSSEPSPGLTAVPPPAPANSGDTTPAPQRERGQRPGPAPGEENSDAAAAILNKYF